MRWNIGYFGVKDLFTLINLLGGVFGVYFAFRGEIAYASVSIFLGYALGDVLDGPVARLTNTSNKFGGEFDSAADHFSQGVAPAIIVFSAYRLAGQDALGVVVMAILIASASIRNARFYVDKWNYPLTWCGLPRTISGLTAVSLPNTTLFFQDAAYGLEGAAVILGMVAALNICPVPYTTHKGRKLQTWVRILIVAFFVTPVTLAIIMPDFAFDFLFVWTLGYALTGWMPLTPKERREFWMEYKRWSKAVSKQ